jgi:hypothetical protein
MSQGVHCISYEIGVDTRIYNDGAYKAQNAIELRAAVSDPQWKHIESNLPLQLAQNGLRGAMFFNGEMQPESLAQGQGYWGISWGIKTASPKQQFHNEWQANPPVYTKNVVPGLLDTRISIGYYAGVPSDYPWNTMQSPAAQYPLPGDRWRYIVNSTETRTMTVTLFYKRLTSVAHTVKLNRNGVEIGTFGIPTGALGTIAATNSLSVPMEYGPNAIDLLRDYANNHFEIRELSFV